jgi:hypothetical protein
MASQGLLCQMPCAQMRQGVASSLGHRSFTGTPLREPLAQRRHVECGITAAASTLKLPELHSEASKKSLEQLKSSMGTMNRECVVGLSCSCALPG